MRERGTRRKGQEGVLVYVNDDWKGQETVSRGCLCYQQIDEQPHDEDRPYQLLYVLDTGVVGAIAQHVEVAFDKRHCNKGERGMDMWERVGSCDYMTDSVVSMAYQSSEPHCGWRVWISTSWGSENPQIGSAFGDFRFLLSTSLQCWGSGVNRYGLEAAVLI